MISYFPFLFFSKKKKKERTLSKLLRADLDTDWGMRFSFCTCRDDGTGGASNTEYAWGRREKRWWGVQEAEAARRPAHEAGRSTGRHGLSRSGGAGRHRLSCRWWRRQTRVIVLVVTQADTGCRAGGDAGRHGLSCRWWRRQTRVVVMVVMQADTGCRAGGDACRHGLSCRWWLRQTRVVVPVVTQADTGCRAGGDAGRHGLSCRWWRRQTQVVVPVQMQAGTGCHAIGLQATERSRRWEAEPEQDKWLLIEQEWRVREKCNIW